MKQYNKINWEIYLKNNNKKLQNRYKTAKIIIIYVMYIIYYIIKLITNLILFDEEN